ncbi:MAG: ABC transporter substrate-binding protein, partial [Sphaerospermopsis kisseleviana]
MKFNKNILNHTTRLLLLITILSFTALSITGCNPSNFKSNASQQVPQLVTSILSDPKTFNYALSSESPNIFGYTYE